MSQLLGNSRAEMKKKTSAVGLKHKDVRQSYRASPGVFNKRRVSHNLLGGSNKRLSPEISLTTAGTDIHRPTA